jgi:hypothetical protein
MVGDHLTTLTSETPSGVINFRSCSGGIHGKLELKEKQRENGHEVRVTTPGNRKYTVRLHGISVPALRQLLKLHGKRVPTLRWELSITGVDNERVLTPPRVWFTLKPDGSIVIHVSPLSVTPLRTTFLTAN